jgi:hypothetical protein
MAIETCLVIKPRLTDAASLIRQTDVIKAVLRAVKQAKLTLLGSEGEGVALDEIIPDAIEQVLLADVVVVDATCYDKSATFRFSPFIYYFVGVCHALGRPVILVSNSPGEMPHNLRAITFSDAAEALEFLDRFEKEVNKIRAGSGPQSDNPIQEYLNRKKMEAENIQLRKEVLAKAAQLDELSKSKTPPSTISFRRVR